MADVKKQKKEKRKPSSADQEALRLQRMGLYAIDAALRDAYMRLLTVAYEHDNDTDPLLVLVGDIADRVSQARVMSQARIREVNKKIEDRVWARKPSD